MDHPNPIALSLAREIADTPRLRSLCLLGSSARGDGDHDSDVDLLGLVERGADRSAVRAEVCAAHRSAPIQLKLLTESGLDALFRRRSTFGVHVLTEAVVVKDDDGRFADIRATHTPAPPVRPDAPLLRLRLEPYFELDWCGGWYLYCLADCYSVGRAAAYMLLGASGRFEFSGQAALRRVGEVVPELRDPAARVARLRPFFVLAHRDAEHELPFDHRHRADEARAAVDAARALVDALT